MWTRRADASFVLRLPLGNAKMIYSTGEKNTRCYTTRRCSSSRLYFNVPRHRFNLMRRISQKREGHEERGFYRANCKSCSNVAYATALSVYLEFESVLASDRKRRIYRRRCYSRDLAEALSSGRMRGRSGR